jgi:MFS transporter, DHA1 family, inner membrane transport protein
MINSMRTQSMAERSSSSMWLPISVATFFRLVLNTARRFAYPFAPALSRGLGVSLADVTSLIAVNQLTSVLGALVGPLSDRLGYRTMMTTGLALLGVGMLAAAFFPVYAFVLSALLLAGLGKSIFDPAVQAWAGSRVPFRRRALVIGFLETSWSASTLIGIPLVAVLMDLYGWRSPFLAMGVLGGVGAVILFFIMPKTNHPVQPATSLSEYLGAFGQLAASRPALGALGYAFFISAANDNLFVVYGAWLEKDFGLGILSLGMGTSVIGAAELLGEGVTAAASDRLGLKRAVFTGLSLCSLSYFALPWLDGSLTAAMTGMAILFFTFEFTVVTSLSLCTELLPGCRATMMAGFLAAAGIGRVLGALMGTAVWHDGGIATTASVSGAMTILGFLCLVYGLGEWRAVEG